MSVSQQTTLKVSNKQPVAPCQGRSKCRHLFWAESELTAGVRQEVFGDLGVAPKTGPGMLWSLEKELELEQVTSQDRPNLPAWPQTWEYAPSSWDPNLRGHPGQTKVPQWYSRSFFTGRKVTGGAASLQSSYTGRLCPPSSPF